MHFFTKNLAKNQLNWRQNDDTVQGKKHGTSLL